MSVLLGASATLSSLVPEVMMTEIAAEFGYTTRFVVALTMIGTVCTSLIISSMGNREPLVIDRPMWPRPPSSTIAVGKEHGITG